MTLPGANSSPFSAAMHACAASTCKHDSTFANQTKDHEEGHIHEPRILTRQDIKHEHSDECLTSIVKSTMVIYYRYINMLLEGPQS